ncbi:RNA-directed DNA polymerase, eukaryota, reverse transcriptase zinc-binding domain protein [Tanacetum coccineum]
MVDKRDGRNICMWCDKWHDNRLLIDKISNRDLYDARIPKMISIDDMIDKGVWKWPNEWNSSKFKVIKIRPLRLQTGMIDKVKWKGKDNTLVPFNTTLVMETLIMRGRLLTQDRIMKWGQVTGLLCPLCSKICDSHSHLFFQCDYAIKIRKAMAEKLNLRKIGYKWEEIISDLIETKNGNNI